MRDESPEAVAQLRADYEAATDPKQKERFRGRLRRAEERIQKATQATQEELNAAQSFPDYWKAQRATLTAEQRAEFEQRESEVLDLQFAMEKYIAGNYDDVTDPENRVPLSAIIEEVQEEVAQHGLCDAVILVIPKLWTEQEKNLRESIVSKGGATATLLTHGYRLALDGFLYERFYQKFLVKRQPGVQKPEGLYVSLRCSTCNTLPVSVTSATAAAYSRTQDYKCSNCLERAAKNRNFAREQRSSDHAIFDGWGRVLDQ